jgi:murein L,D-transpeptidase YcbB/YkuD
MMIRKLFGWMAVIALVAITATGFSWRSSSGSVLVVDDASAATMQVVVNLSDRRLRVMSGDEVLKSYPVAIGKEGHRTPTGSFNVRRIIWNPSWTPPDASWARGKKPTPPGAADNPMGRVKIFFAEPDYFIHGTNDPASVGKAASHGCLRMRNADIIELAQLLMKHGGATKPESWFRRVVNRVTDTQDVRLGSAVPMRVRS